MPLLSKGVELTLSRLNQVPSVRSTLLSAKLLAPMATFQLLSAGILALGLNLLLAGVAGAVNDLVLFWKAWARECSHRFTLARLDAVLIAHLGAWVAACKLLLARLLALSSACVRAQFLACVPALQLTSARL